MLPSPPIGIAVAALGLISANRRAPEKIFWKIEFLCHLIAILSLTPELLCHILNKIAKSDKIPKVHMALSSNG